MRNFRTVLILFSLLLFFSCSHVEQEDATIKAALQAVKDQFAPDRRVAVFDITWERQGNSVVVKGEVDNPSAKSEVLAAIVESGIGQVMDSVRVLPDPGLGENQFGIIIVSVANVRTKPQQSAELATQVLMGMAVKLLKKHGGWYYVQSHDKYLGWLEDDAMEMVDRFGLQAWEDSPKAITTELFGLVREKPDRHSAPVCDVVAGSLLKSLGTKGEWTEVELADGRSGFLPSNFAEEYQKWIRTRQLDAANVEKVAKMMVGLPYLWGGTSVKGMDCSGFTKMVFRLNGKELNRDANQQALMGEEVFLTDDFRNLLKGDLLFFGRKAVEGKPERISHVGIYLGNKEFIHSSGRVRINSLDPSAPNYDEFNRKRLVRARRIIASATVPEISG